MDVEDLLASARVSEVSVDTERALVRTVRRGQRRRRRRLAGIVCGGFIVATIVAGLSNLIDPGTPEAVSSGGAESAAETSAPTSVTGPAHECEAADGTDTDIGHEPDWRQYADYLPWTDQRACLLRIDVVAERRGPDHCGWQRSRTLIVGRPLGTRYSSPTDSVEYTRDPEGVLGRPDITAGFDPDATLPADAVDSGYRRGTAELWHRPDDPSAIWLRSPDGVERWPAGDAPLCL